MADPFADPGFQERTRKLLGVLATTQPGEAEAARRKLLAHLEGHGASWSDLVDRLAGAAPASGLFQSRPGDRAAWLAAEQRAQAAESRAVAASATAVQAVRRAEAAETVRRRDRLIAGGFALVAVAAMGWSVLRGPRPQAASPPSPHQPAAAAIAPVPDALPRAAAAGPAAGQLAYVVAAGAAMRPAGTPGDPTRLLPSGAPVVVLGRTWLDSAEWIRVRTELGEGFLPIAAISFVQPSSPPMLPGAAAPR